jgi:hypothetical protein
MYYAMERLGRGGDGNSSSSFYTWGGRAATAAAVSGLQGLIKGVVLALVKVRPKAACRTCCWDGIIESSNLAKKSMHRIGVAMAASKKSNSKFWLEKQTMWWRKPQAGICLPLAPTRCGPLGGAELECGKIEMDAPELTKILKLFRES